VDHNTPAQADLLAEADPLTGGATQKERKKTVFTLPGTAAYQAAVPNRNGIKNSGFSF